MPKGNRPKSRKTKYDKVIFPKCRKVVAERPIDEMSRELKKDANLLEVDAS
jgi:hypothetical protein